MRVKIKKMNDKAVMPKKIFASDYGFDVVATSCEEIAPHVYKYGIGLAFEIERVFEAEGEVPVVSMCIELRARSSVWETGMMLTNNIGTIDKDYRGEVSAVFWHYDVSKPKYKVGDRIGQIALSITDNMQFEWAEELSNTERGAGGYGSTGK